MNSDSVSDMHSNTELTSASSSSTIANQNRMNNRVIRRSIVRIDIQENIVGNAVSKIQYEQLEHDYQALKQELEDKNKELTDCKYKLLCIKYNHLLKQFEKVKHDSKKSKLKLKEYKDKLGKDDSGNQSTSLNLSEKFDSDDEDAVIFIENDDENRDFEGKGKGEKIPIERKPGKSKEIKPKVTFSKQNTSTPKNKADTNMIECPKCKNNFSCDGYEKRHKFTCRK